MAATAGAQTANNNAPREVIANGGLLHTLLAERVRGQPYSAVQVHKTKQTLADERISRMRGIILWRGILSAGCVWSFVCKSSERTA